MKFSKGFLEELLKKEDFFSISISKYSITLLIYFINGKKEERRCFGKYFKYFNNFTNILLFILETGRKKIKKIFR